MTRKVIGTAATLKEAKDMLEEYNINFVNLSKEEFTLGDLFEKWKESKHAKSLKTEMTLIIYIETFKSTFSSLFNESFTQLTFKPKFHQNLYAEPN